MHIARVYMTPKDLREIADLMEERIKTALVGDDLGVKDWYEDNLVVKFVVDQERLKVGESSAFDAQK